MGRQRKCILCQIVYNSKQEMDDHMRSMLHHRELENLKGRDCGHECQVCQVTMVSLTDYANHISSQVHKQLVERAEEEGAGNDQEEEYFDKELVKLIETRKEQIRKEEVAAAKRAGEEEERRRREEEHLKQQKQIQNWNSARQYFQRGASLDWRNPSDPPSSPASLMQRGWAGGSTPGGPSSWQIQDSRSNWHKSKQGRSATWHAQEPPNFSKWPCGERGSLQSRDGWANHSSKRWEGSYSPAKQRGGRGPWPQSNRGGGSTGSLSNNGGNLSSTESLLRMDVTRGQITPASSFAQLPQGAPFKPQDDGRKGGHQNVALRMPGSGATESVCDNSLGTKAFGSNPKLDKVHRWSPYPHLPHPHPPPLERLQSGPPPTLQTQNPTGQDCDVNMGLRCDTVQTQTQSRWDQRGPPHHQTGQQVRPSDHRVEGMDCGKQQENISRNGSSSDLSVSKSPSVRRDSQASNFSSGSNTSYHNAVKPLECLEKCVSKHHTTKKKKRASNSQETEKEGATVLHIAEQQLEVSGGVEANNNPKRELLSRLASITRSSRTKPSEDRTITSSKPKPSEDITITSSRTKPSEDRTITSSKPKPSEDITITSNRTKPSEDRTITSSRTKPSEDRTITSSRTKPSEDRTITSSRTKPSEDRTITSSRTKPSEDRTITSSKPKPSEDRTITSSRTKPPEDRTITSNRMKPSEDRTITSNRMKPSEDRTTRSSGSAADLIGVLMESGPSTSEDPPSLQSVQISTSTMEIPGGSTLCVRAGSEQGEREGESDLGADAGDGKDAVQISDAGLDSDPDPDLHVTTDPSSSSAQANTLTTVTLPPPLKRDLTRQVGLKTKIGTHEPNLNIARRIRNVSGTRRGEVEKDSGLKPTLRQLISSSGSRRCVNWDQVYQEVHRKKQEQGKGMPRFGIEMVSYDQEGLSQEEDLPLTEGFQWESFLNFGDSGPALAPVTPRKRSLSESSVAPDRSATNLSSLFGGQSRGAGQAMPEGPGEERARKHISEQQGSTREEPQPKVEGTHCEAEGPIGALVQQKADSVMGDSSSGTENNESLGTGKKRRAAGDVPSPEVPSADLPSSERRNKRMKVKSKRERLQVDQLLTVSLREDELSRALQGIDDSLIQARATLQAAYIEVQRLLVVKQQVSTEMSALRSKRIELLQGMQGGYEATPPDPSVKSCEEEMPLEDRPLTDAPPPCPDQASRGAVPLGFPPCSSPSSLPPCQPPQPPAVSSGVVIKQEPLSPGAASRESARGSAECHVHLGGHHSPHSTTPEPTAFAPHTESAPSDQSVFRGRREVYRSSREPSQEESIMPMGESDQSGSLDRAQQVEQGVQVNKADIWDCKPSPALLPSPSRTEPLHAEAPPALPLPQGEVKAVKRVRKLKKKRLLRKAQGVELQPDNSDTELETETAPSRPNRRLRRRASGSPPQVTTSTPQGAAEDRVEGSVDAPGSPAARPEDRQLNSDSSLEMVELTHAPPVEVVSIDTSNSDEGSMEVCSIAPPPDLLKPKPQKLACNKVTSTSGMELSTKIGTCPSPALLSRTSNQQPKTSSDISSELREEELPSEGLFQGHQEAVKAMQVHMGLLFTCSGDLTVRAFDLVSRQCVAVFEGHSSKVNCLVVPSGPGLKHRLYSGSSDQTIRCYSLQTKECLDIFSLPDRVLCLHHRWKVLYAGLGNGSVVTFSLKTNKQLDVFDCHGPRAVSCLATAQEGARRILLVGSYDTTISVRDAKSGLLLRTLEGHSKTVLCMNVANELVFSGSSDQSVHAHNIHTGELVRVYEGHGHAVTVVAIVGKVMVTACLDKLVRVYELQSNDHLQVYGGHKDMVMCMVIHKSMIYTGCYDGSVQAVKLNLMQNYRCWWHGCSLIFGVFEHLQQHLVCDHTSNNTQTLKCRWKTCSKSFATRNGSKQPILQGVPKHVLKHAEEELQVEKSDKSRWSEDVLNSPDP